MVSVGPARGRRGAFAEPGEAHRPRSPDKSYGVPVKGGTLVTWSWVVEQLTAAQDYWLATIQADGGPHAAPVWGLFIDDELLLETSPATLKARNLAADPRVAVHVGGGIAVVIVNGTAHDFRPPPDLGPRLAAAFKAKYPGYEPTPSQWDGGSLYRVVPKTVLGWREMNTATRWKFGARRP